MLKASMWNSNRFNEYALRSKTDNKKEGEEGIYSPPGRFLPSRVLL